MTMAQSHASRPGGFVLQAGAFLTGPGLQDHGKDVAWRHQGAFGMVFNSTHGEFGWLVVWNINFYLSVYWECHHPN